MNSKFGNKDFFVFNQLATLKPPKSVFIVNYTFIKYVSAGIFLIFCIY
jgi:hypothetical protein